LVLRFPAAGAAAALGFPPAPQQGKRKLRAKGKPTLWLWLFPFGLWFSLLQQQENGIQSSRKTEYNAAGKRAKL
jgi:hypothetical protein